MCVKLKKITYIGLTAFSILYSFNAHGMEDEIEKTARYLAKPKGQKRLSDLPQKDRETQILEKIAKANAIFAAAKRGDYTKFDQIAREQRDGSPYSFSNIFYSKFVDKRGD